MHVPRPITGFWDTVRKNWRAPSESPWREQLAGQLCLVQLEERRVLTVSVNAGVALPLEASVAAHAPVGPTLLVGPHSAHAGNSAGSEARTQVGPTTAVAANHAPTSGSAGVSAAATADALGNVADSPPVTHDGDEGPTLVVAPNQVTAAGSLLPIANIGQFTDPASAIRTLPTRSTGDGLPADTGCSDDHDSRRRARRRPVRSTGRTRCHTGRVYGDGHARRSRGHQQWHADGHRQ